MTICDKCFEITTHTHSHECQKGRSSIYPGTCDGNATLITSYFDFTNYEVVKLYLNTERSLTLLSEKREGEKYFEVNACRVVDKRLY